METPRSIQRAKSRLHLWRTARWVLTWVIAFVIAGISSNYLKVSPWLTLCGLSVVGVLIQPIVRRKAPRSVRWLAHDRDSNAAPPVAEAFELTVPCEKCGAMNHGVEAAEHRGGDGVLRVFRTCKPCGHTQWWTSDRSPPRIRRWHHADTASKSCPACGYSLKATPISPIDREGNVVVSERRCPECGRQEFFRHRDDSVTPPPPPQSASRSAAGSGSAGA